MYSNFRADNYSPTEFQCGWYYPSYPPLPPALMTNVPYCKNPRENPHPKITHGCLQVMQKSSRISYMDILVLFSDEDFLEDFFDRVVVIHGRTLPLTPMHFYITLCGQNGQIWNTTASLQVIR